jgi:hypothetical protein
MVESNPAERWDWLWLVLPIRFGVSRHGVTLRRDHQVRRDRQLVHREPAVQQRVEPDWCGGRLWILQPEPAEFAVPGQLPGQFQDRLGLLQPDAAAAGARCPDSMCSTGSSARRLAALDKSSGPAFFPGTRCRSAPSGVTGGVSMFQPTDAWMGLFGFNELFIPLLEQLAAISWRQRGEREFHRQPERPRSAVDVRR